ncbi:hypothetical protein VTO42DRAFT_1701 [Malbranchea cinnamomea]
MDQKFANEFKRETWALYAVGVLAAILRSVARIKRLGIRSLQLDDYLIVLAVVWYTVLCVALNEVVSGGGSNLMSEEDIRNLTPETHAERVRGSKWVFVSEHVMVLTIWTLKTVMLLIYARITNGLTQRRLVNYCAIYVGLGFVVSELCLFLICRPLSNYWAVPTSDYQCSSYQYYEIIQGVFAISADMIMLLIAIPLLMAVRLPPRQKWTLVFLFGLGIFVIVAAILTKVYCLVPKLISYVYMSWYFREATVAMLVTCLPLTWSLLRDIFPALRSWTGGSRPTHQAPYTVSDRTHSRPADFKNYHLRSFSRFKAKNDGREDFGHETMVTRAESSSRAGSSSTNQSQECVQTPSREADTYPLHGNQIRQDVTITVQTEHNRSSDESGQNTSHPFEQDSSAFGPPSSDASLDLEQQRRYS